MANRFLTPNVQFVDFNGRPLSFGRVFFYYSKTSTPLDTYSNLALSIINPNPITLDAFGRAGSIFLGTLPYKVVLENSRGDQVWTEDPVTRQQSSITGAGGNLTGTINFAMGASVDAGSIGPTPPPGSIYLPPGTTFWIATATLFDVEAWGSGGSPSGGGAYSAIPGITATLGQIFAVNIPAGNSGATLGNAATWFNTQTYLRAQSASNLPPGIGGGGGGEAANGLGDVRFSGGNSGLNSAGGGGAGGPHGNGADGGSNTDRFHGSGGGGGADGGTAGASVDGSTSSGGEGGENFVGQHGGAGGSAGGPGGNGLHPGVGGGGAGNVNNGAANNGGNGADDPDNGGGGGGAATEDQTSSGAVGGNGGFPGGGAGASRWGTNGTPAGGQIKITPAS